MTKQPYWQTLPRGFSLYVENGSTYLQVNGRHIVTEDTGKRRAFRGTDETTQARVKKWAWRYCDGAYRGEYRLQRDGEQVW